MFVGHLDLSGLFLIMLPPAKSLLFHLTNERSSMCHTDQSEAQVCPVFTFHKSPSMTQAPSPEPSPDAGERGETGLW